MTAKGRPSAVIKDGLGEVEVHHAYAGDVVDAVDGMPTVMRSTANYKIGGYDYPMKSTPGCGVCQSTHRSAIENALIKGFAKARIEREFAALGVHISRASMTTHVTNGDMPVDQTVRRVALEQRMAQIGRIEEDIEDTLVDHMSLLNEVTRRTYERIAAGEIEPEVSDGVSAAKALLAVSDIDGNAIDAALVGQVMQEMLSEMRQVMAPDDFQRIIMRIRSNETLRHIDARLRREKAIAATSEETPPDSAAEG